MAAVQATACVHIGPCRDFSQGYLELVICDVGCTRRIARRLPCPAVLTPSIGANSCRRASMHGMLQ